MYQSFKPNPLPPIPEIEMDGEIVKLLVDANKQLVKLDTASQLISNADLFISMYVRKEALISSQIEGTQCTLDDVLDPEVEANMHQSGFREASHSPRTPTVRESSVRSAGALRPIISAGTSRE